MAGQEFEPLRRLSRSLSCADNRTITARLFVTFKTVKYHITNVFAKLGVSNRTEAAGFAIRHGLGE